MSNDYKIDYEQDTVLEADRALEPGVTLKVAERSRGGMLVGFWEGHYSDEKQSVMLYPKGNPFCTWRVPRIVHPVDARIIRVRKAQASENKTTVRKTAQRDKGDFRESKRGPILGQEKIEF